MIVEESCADAVRQVSVFAPDAYNRDEMDTTPFLKAFQQREALLASLASEQTDSYRLFHGTVEGIPGLTVDRYGPHIVVQTFRDPLDEASFAALSSCYGELFADELPVVINHRGKRAPQDATQPNEAWMDTPVLCQELGISYYNIPRHRGIDPLFFLDFRAVRRFLKENAEGKSVLNLFSYTCTSGVAAAMAGATSVWNVDFAGTSLEWGSKSAEANGLPASSMRMVQEDVFPVIRQLAGLPLKGRAARSKYTKLPARSFSIVVLDPPTYAKSRWGCVDLANDYQSLFKPALLATEDGGCLIATNHLAKVDADEWKASLLRCATKAGRPLRELVMLPPEDDFPTFDGRPPLKMALCYV